MSKLRNLKHPPGANQCLFTSPDLVICCYCLVAQSCPNLATPWTVARRAPLSMGFFRKEHWNGLPFPSPGDLPDPEIEPEIEPVSPDLAGGFFTTEPLGKLSLLCGSLLLFKEENCSDLATSSQICQPFPRILESWITRNLCKTVSHSYSTPIYQ